MSVEEHQSPKHVVCQHISCLLAERPFNNLEKVHPGMAGCKVACKGGLLFYPT